MRQALPSDLDLSGLFDDSPLAGLDDRDRATAFRLIDTACGRQRPERGYRDPDILGNGKGRDWYPFAFAEIRDAGGLTPQEALSYLRAVVQDGRRPVRMRHGVPDLMRHLVNRLRWIPFEPKWHMDARRSSRPIPAGASNSTPVWEWLLGIYNDPRRSVTAVPEWVWRQVGRDRTLRDRIAGTRAEGKSECRRLFGPDFDTTDRQSTKVQEEYVPVFDVPEMRDGSFLRKIGAGGED